jgi:hypothetical protein
MAALKEIMLKTALGRKASIIDLAASGLGPNFTKNSVFESHDKVQ